MLSLSVESTPIRVPGAQQNHQKCVRLALMQHERKGMFVELFIQPWRGLMNRLCPTLVVPLADGQNSCHPQAQGLSLKQWWTVKWASLNLLFYLCYPFKLEHSFSRGNKQSTTILPGTQCPLGFYSLRTAFHPSTEQTPHYCPQTILLTFFILYSLLKTT